MMQVGKSLNSLREEKHKDASHIANQIIASLPDGGLWEDPDFTLASCQKQMQNFGSTFKRPTEISGNAILFDGGVSPLDVIQGGLGNCWFVQAIATVAQLDPGLIEDMIIPYPQHGFYQVIWWKDSSFTVVTIDDRLLVGPRNNLLYARGKSQNEFWVPLLEKSYAKLHGGYSRISGGLPTEALIDFTGGVGKLSTNKEEWWDLISVGTNDNSMMAISTPPSSQGDSDFVHGLPQQHAYGLLRGVSITNPPVQLTFIRNPHSCNEWDGAWSDGSAEWTTEIAAEVGHQDDKTDGCFFMEIHDVKKHFVRLSVVRSLSNFVHTLYPSEVSPDHFYRDNAWSENDMWLLKTNRPGPVVICLRKPDKRRESCTIDPSLLMALGVCRRVSPSEKDRSLTKFFSLPCLTNERDVHFDVQVGPNQMFTVVPIFHSTKTVPIKYYFSVFSVPGVVVTFKKIES
eukprot:TRINITY_DN3685_c0_g1_i16.p1 TRINITY_DN3685_c0_g1~~TRINITY_DN3685_c0_g1_i16.p1  ORF type:complete len:456 (-),score=110.30 TRINITY_DN3685_c0_g1_i16:319-1686(-)